MFRKMNNGNIVMTRGDTGSLTVTLNKGSTVNPDLHILMNGDKVYLGIMEANASFEDPIVCKIITSNGTGSEEERKKVSFTITSADTVNLLAGNYYYEVKVVRPVVGGADLVYTVQKRTKFTIIE